MLNNFLKKFQNDSDEDSEASIDDDTRSTISHASTTFSQRELDLEDENRTLKQAAITTQNDIIQLKAQLEALQIAAAQSHAREREAAERARQIEEQALIERNAAAQRIEAAIRQAAEEKVAREHAENQAKQQEEQIAVLHSRLIELALRDTERKAAEEIIKKQQAELAAAEERRKAEDAFSKSCSTGARTLEEHYRLLRAAIMKAGF